MPKSLAVDWKQIEVLYSTGSRPADLAAQFGVKSATIYRRVSRHHWRGNRTIARQNVVDSVQRASEKLKTNLSVELVAQSESLQRVPSKDCLTDIGTRAEIVSELAAAGSKVFGWQDNRTFLVNVSGPLFSNEEPVIDVAATPAVEASSPS